MTKQRFSISGMTCAACSAHVERSVSALSGISSLSVSLLTDSMTVVYDEEKTSAEKIMQAVRRAGYSASLYEDRKEIKNKRREREAEFKSNLKKLLFSAFFLLVLMYLSMGKMLSLPYPPIFENPLVLAAAEFIFCIPIIVINRRYLIDGIRALAGGAPNMDSLILIGVFGSVGYGIFGLIMIISGKPEYVKSLYFESAGMILTFVSIGKMLEMRARGKTSEAIEMLSSLAPKDAAVIKDGKEILIPREKIEVGDIVAVRAGETVPADGTVTEGEGSADESVLTGESMPISKVVGDQVSEASTLSSGYIKMRADRVGEDSSLAQIVRLLEEAAASKAPIAKLADKVSGIFVPVVISISVITFTLWMIIGYGVEFALTSAIAVLVISCPCVLGLATPTAIMVASGRGARLGVLIKSAEALETLSKVKYAFLDKTGTITEGKPSVTDIIPFGIDENELLSLIYSLEKMSEHPISSAFSVAAEKKNLSAYEVEDYTAWKGLGISGKIRGSAVYIGNKKFIEKCGIEFSYADTLEKLSSEGKTPVIIAENEKVIGIAAVADACNPDSKAAIARFRELGIEPIMLTGDNEKTAKAIGAKVGIDKIYASKLPDAKEKAIREMKKSGCVAMIGDGINDAPALTSADVGIAIGAGSGIAIESADIVLRKSTLADAAAAFELGRAALRNIKQNLFWALIYNSLGIPLAAGVLYPVFHYQLSPVIASAAMSLSSVCVVLNALRLRKFKPKNIKNTEENTKSEEKKVMAQEQHKTMIIEGMMCGHCSARVEAALNGIAGVKAKITLEEKKADIVCGSDVSDETLTKAVINAGYKVVSIK